MNNVQILTDVLLRMSGNNTGLLMQKNINPKLKSEKQLNACFMV